MTKMQQWRRIASSAIWLIGGNASSRLATMVVLIVAGRLLGPSTYGTFAALQGVAMFGVSFAEFGLTTWGVRSLSRGKSQSESLTLP